MPLHPLAVSHRDRRVIATMQQMGGYDANLSMQQPSHQDPSRPPSSVKLFIGQIGRTADEAEIRALLEAYGGVHDVSMIRDKATGTSKGCAFVIMARRVEADAAIKALHGKHMFSGMNTTLQISYAKGEEERVDAKLFVGMITKTCDETELRGTFGPFGDIEEVYIMKDKATQQNKGCAFVKYSCKSEALRAIQSLHGKVTMPGNQSPLVVKWADPPKDPSKQVVSQQANPMQNFQAQMMAQAQLMQQSMFGGMQQPAWGAPAAPQQAIQPQMQMPYGMPQQAASGYDAYGGAQNMYGADPSMAAYGGGMGLGAGMANPMAAMGMMGGGGYGMGMGGGMASSAPKSAQGPANANLFIYHIPVHWGETEMLQCFTPFGNVVSATVFKDKNTGQSKGFGFVSYDNSASAANAISAMNGMQVDGKRLKVEIKKAKGGTPY